MDGVIKSLICSAARAGVNVGDLRASDCARLNNSMKGGAVFIVVGS